MNLRSEYQRTFIANKDGSADRNYKEMLNDRRRRKSNELRHTPLIWLDENSEDKISKDNVNKKLRKQAHMKDVIKNGNPTLDIELEEESLKENKSVQTNDTMSRKDVGVQSPCRRSTRKKTVAVHSKDQLKKQVAINHEKPIIAYGWADKESMCKKRTFNVKAPSAEVRKSALRAAKIRENYVKTRLTRKEKLLKEKLKKQVLLDSLTHFNQWQTEYQKQFCK